MLLDYLNSEYELLYFFDMIFYFQKLPNPILDVKFLLKKDFWIIYTSFPVWKNLAKSKCTVRLFRIGNEVLHDNVMYPFCSKCGRWSLLPGYFEIIEILLFLRMKSSYTFLLSIDNILPHCIYKKIFIHVKMYLCCVCFLESCPFKCISTFFQDETWVLECAV